MFTTRHLVRSGVNVLRLNATSGVVRHSVTPVPQPIPLSSAVCHRCVTTGKLVTQSAPSRAKQEVRIAVTISNTVLQNDDWMLEVQWGDGGTAKYPYIWLRDNCQCPACFHTTSKARRVLLQDLDIRIVPRSVKINDNRDKLEISWSDGHAGVYPADWLEDRAFTDSKRKKRQKINGFNRSYWGSDIRNRLPEADFNQLLQEDGALHEFLKKLEELGLVIVRETPRQAGEIVKLSDRVGFLKKTHYGNTFSVKQKVDANNLAYTSDSLNLHVDLPFLLYKPGVQLLHCISQTPGEGGENHFVDSFKVALQLRDQSPEKFKILTQTLVDFTDQGVEEDGLQFHAQNQEPMIVLDSHGLVNTINLNQMTRDSYFDASVDEVREWYDAMLTFHDLLYHPDNIITYKMREGDIAVFDNNRVMHGRKGYRMTEGCRELEGCYWDWDVVKSCRRTLKRKMGIEE